ncbi:MAG TPA: tyrosine-type recombinase/integrase [Nitriliruptorales bacterium]
MDVRALDHLDHQDHLDAFAAWGRTTRGWLASTTDAYRWQAAHLHRWLAAHHVADVGMATPDLLGAWVGRTEAAESRKHRRNALAAWCTWLASTGALAGDPMCDVPTVRARQRLPRALTRPAAEAVYAAAAAAGPRWHVAVCLLACQGLRNTEARGLRWDAISAGTMRFVAKGGSEHALPVLPDTAAALASWRAHCPSATWVMASPLPHRDAPCSAKYLRRGVGEVGVAAGLGHLTPHQLRHTCAILLLNAGARPHEVRDWLRHASLATTDIYTHVNPDHLLDVGMRLDLSGRRPDPTPTPPAAHAWRRRDHLRIVGDV